ncbi:MAG TPA: hypothetical protein VMM15_18065, partial [Bradyrhizobium sp.]|nr:hypothetical protein [Bradyrhizobium sp.]
MLFESLNRKFQVRHCEAQSADLSAEARKAKAEAIQSLTRGSGLLRYARNDSSDRVGKGALAPCPPSLRTVVQEVGTLRFAHPHMGPFESSVLMGAWVLFMPLRGLEWVISTQFSSFWLLR